MAHVAASTPKNDQLNILMNKKPNLGIVSAYNDMLSAHKPYENYPSLISLFYSLVMLVVRCPHESSDGGCRDSIHRRDRGTSVIEELQMKSFKSQHHARHDRMRRCVCYAWLF